MTSYNLEAGVKSQIQPLEKIPCPCRPTSCFHIPNVLQQYLGRYKAFLIG